MAASGVRFGDGIVYTFRDITEDERLDKAKTDFVATVSHELRTPLASVYGAAVTLRARYSTLDVQRRDLLLDLLAEQANRLSTIIDELLLASSLAGRLDARRCPVEGEGFDPDEVARAVVEAARVHAPTGIEIELVDPAVAARRDRRRGEGRAGAREPRRERGQVLAGRRRIDVVLATRRRPGALRRCATRGSGSRSTSRNGSSRSSTASIRT